MEATRRFLAIMVADARQRWRARPLRAWLLVLVAATWFCFPAADAGYRVLGVGPFRSAYTSAWAGMVVAMLMTWLSLVGFYLVRGTVTRDIESRCWQLLVATPLSRAGYLLAKWLSHLLVLVAIAVGMLVVAGIAVSVRGEAPGIEPVELGLPLLVLGLPALGICALCAVVFDFVPALRHTLGNALYAVLWVLMLAAASVGGGNRQAPSIGVGDVHGITVFQHALAAAADAQGIDAGDRRTCLLCGSAGRAGAPIIWQRWSPTRAELLGRAFWMLLPLPLLVVAARGLDLAAASPLPSAGRRSGTRRLAWLRWLLTPLQHKATLASLELQHALRERPLPVWAGLLLAWGVQLLAAPALACLAVIGAWALFLPVFSHAALRERECALVEVVRGSVDGGSRLLRARGVVLVLLGLGCAAPALVRFAVGQPPLCLAVLALVASLSAWSLALGTLTGSARPFEVLFVLGGLLALNGVGVLDASVAPASTLFAHLALLPIALVLLGLAARSTRRVPGPRARHRNEPR